jgi:hypothetical protein
LAYLCKKNIIRYENNIFITNNSSHSLAYAPGIWICTRQRGKKKVDDIETVDGGNPAKQHNSTFLVTLGYNFNM